MIKAVIFDCFGVLYVDPGLHFYEANVPHFAELRDKIFDIDKQCDYGYIDEEAHDRAVAEITGIDFDFIHRNIRGEQVRNEPLLAYSQKLRGAYKLGMLSNVGRSGMDRFFTHNECRDYFDETVLSSEVGMIKPEKEIFTLMAERLGVSTSECVMIDDRQDNIDGARTAGMSGILFSNIKQLESELTALLEQASA